MKISMYATTPVTFQLISANMQNFTLNGLQLLVSNVIKITSWNRKMSNVDISQFL